MKQNNKGWLEDMIDAFNAEPVLLPKQIKAVDVYQLLKDINSLNSITLAEVNKVILKQIQYDLTVIDN